MFFTMRSTSPGMVNTFMNDCFRSWLGMAMYKAMARMPNSIHHFSHHVGMSRVIKTETPPNRTINIERGMSACWMVLSIKLILP